VLCLFSGSGLSAQGYDPQSAYEGQYPSAQTPFDDVSYEADWSDNIPAHIAVVDGPAWHERDGQAESAEQNVALLAGDRLRTERGRLEILFADGSAIDLDEGTEVELLSESLIRLDAGRIRLSFVRSSDPIDYRVDAAGTTAWIRTAGEYRISVSRARSATADVRLTVLRGAAEIGSRYGRTLVQTGYEAVASDRARPSLPYVVNASAREPFDRWVEARHNERVGYGYQSTQYLPEEIRYYSGVMDRYGSWSHDASYGYVWYPRVTADWRPYYDGRWSFVGSFGWFWVGATNWSWPTHHYGRWGSNAGRWYWIPDRRWAPAWVSWASTPGYVSWCPLGWDNRPVYHISVSNYDSWRGWTVIPSRSFTHNIHVRRYAVNARVAVPRDARFVLRQQAPVRPVLVRGNERPLRAPTAAVRTRTAQPRADAAVADRQFVGSSAGASRNPSANGRAIAPRTTTGAPGAAASTRGATRRAPEPVQPGNGLANAGSRVYRSPRAEPETNVDRGPATISGARVRTAPDRVERPEPGAPESTRSIARPRVTGPRQTVESDAPSRQQDQPRGAVRETRSSAPERRIDSRPAPRQERTEPPQRSAPTQRAAPGRAAPDRAPREESRARPDNGPSPRAGSGASGETRDGSSNGRTAPSGSGSSGPARARSR
jgi:hypothetical protein